MKATGLIASGSALLVALQAASAAAATASVPGSANPNLAGRADGYSCCSGDSVPEQAATLVEDLTFAPGEVIRFEVSGRVSFGGEPPPGDNPDGDNVFTMTNYGDGVAAPETVRTNALLGVFLGDDSPTGAPTPEPMSFASGLDFAWLTPEIGQIFFIGDGLTSDTNVGSFDGDRQVFIVPAGATRLFLGTCDGLGWYNNGGSFTVDVTSAPRSCGDPAGGTEITAIDAAFVLSAAVGTESCPLCVCDTDTSGNISAIDALVVLQNAVGLGIALECPGC